MKTVRNLLPESHAQILVVTAQYVPSLLGSGLIPLHSVFAPSETLYLSLSSPRVMHSGSQKHQVSREPLRELLQPKLCSPAAVDRRGPSALRVSGGVTSSLQVVVA